MIGAIHKESGLLAGQCCIGIKPSKNHPHKETNQH